MTTNFKMYKSLKISQKIRKNIALSLLLNFLLTTILFAVPAENCNGICDIDQEIHTCSSKMDMANSCCDMMGMNEKKSNSCDTEISDLSCDYEFITSDSYTFIIPKTGENKIILAEVSDVVVDVKQDNSKVFILLHDIVLDISPPIYLSVSSFLI